jgi:hypothetical protein
MKTLPALEYGTEAEHRATLARAKDNEVDYIWSGDLRNNYLRENLRFGIEVGILKAKYIESDQESGYQITWL